MIPFIRHCGFFVLIILVNSCGNYQADGNQKIGKTKGKKVVSFDQQGIPTIELIIKPKGLKKLNSKRKIALKRKLLIKGVNDWVKAKVIYNGDTIKANLRLKGDWTDHLDTPKWSFRVKLKHHQISVGQSIKNVPVFSLQAPETRGFLYEWVLHKLIKQEGLMATGYEFVYVKLNGRILGIYAIEEHFTNELIAANKRPKGILLKFNEDVLWLERLKNKWKNKAHIPIHEVAEVRAYGFNKTPTIAMKEEFNAAQRIMSDYTFGMKPCSEIFDIDKLARFIAIIDVCNAYHTLIWQNQRLYYNSQSNNLEMVAFDGYPKAPVFDQEDQGYIGFGFVNNSLLTCSPSKWGIFNNALFWKSYRSYLEKYADNEFLTSFFSSIEDELNQLGQLIIMEYEDDYFNREYFFNVARSIRRDLKRDSLKLSDLPFGQEFTKFQLPLQNAKKYQPIRDLSVMPYGGFANKDSTGDDVVVYNFYPEKLKIVGLGDTVMRQKTTTPWVKEYRVRESPVCFHINNSNHHPNIYYTVQGYDSVYIQPIIWQPAPHKLPS